MASLLVTACGDERTALVVYSPHGRDLLQLVEAAWEEKHPDIDLRFLDMGSQEVYDRVRSERANPQADVWFGGPSTILGRAASEELLEQHAPAWADRVPAPGRDAGGRWYALYRTPTLIVFNRDAVAEEEVPLDWQDLLRERWRDEIVIRDPLASGTMRTIFGYHVSKSIAETGSTERGFDYLRGLDAQTREYVHSPAILHEKIVRQEGLVSLWELTDILNLIDGGAPLGYRFPKSGTPVIPDSVALVAGAPHRAAAVEFLDWLGSDEALELAARGAHRLPALEGLDASKMPPWIADVTASLVPAEVDWRALEEDGPDWMAEWDQTVRGRGE